jgi:hypothetical protein
MHESDTYLAILDEGQEKCAREDILIVGEERFGPPPEAVTDLPCLKRMVRRGVTLGDAESESSFSSEESGLIACNAGATPAEIHFTSRR